MHLFDYRPTHDRRYLIVNADDLGYSAGVNKGILDAHRDGIVTSASLMVRWPAAADAAVVAREFPVMSVGLHIDLGEWTYCDGQWTELYHVVDLADQAAIEREIERQLETFHALTGHQPTHLDSHQHVHRQEPVRSVVHEFGRRLTIPIRHESSVVRYSGHFYGQAAKGEPLGEAISVESLIRLLKKLPSGITELGCHPGYAHDAQTMYAAERAAEVATLCSPEVGAAIVEFGIELLSFNDVSFLGDRHQALSITEAHA